MDFLMNNILNIVCYLPLAGMILIMLVKRERESAIKWIANITALIGFLVSIPLLTSFNDPRFRSPNGFRFIYEHSWIPQIGAKNMGVFVSYGELSRHTHEIDRLAVFGSTGLFGLASLALSAFLFRRKDF